MARSWVGGGLLNTNIASGTTEYDFLSGYWTGISHSATEDRTTRPVRTGRLGTFSHATVYASLHQSTVDSHVHLNSNGSSAIDITLPSSTTGEFENIATQFTPVDGDELGWELSPGTGGIASRFNRCTVQFDAERSGDCYTLAQTAGDATVQGNNDLEWSAIFGETGSEQLSESIAQNQIRGKYDVRHIHTFVQSQTGTTDNTITLRVNEADTPCVLTIPGGATGHFQDITTAAEVNWGNRVCYGVATSADGGVLVTDGISSDWSNEQNRRQFTIGRGTALGVSQNPNQTRYEMWWTRYLQTLSTETDASISVPFRMTVGFFSLSIHANASTTDSLHTFMRDGATTALALAIPPLSSGWFEDLTNQVIYREGQTLSLQTVTGATASITRGPANFVATQAPRLRPPRGEVVSRQVDRPPRPQIGPSVTIGPPDGALFAQGLAPVYTGVAITIMGAGELCLGGPATPTPPVELAPDAGSLVLQGLAPELFVSVGIEVPTGGLVLNGLAPTRSIGFICPAPTGALVLAGLAPSLTTNTTIDVPTGALVLNGLAPSLAFVCPAPTGALVLTGLAPFASTGVLRPVPAGALVLQGLAPTILAPVSISVPVGALVLNGLAPAIALTIPVPAGTLVLQGLAPQAFVEERETPPAGTLVLQGLAPVIDHGLTPGAGALVLNGLAPTLLFGIRRDPPAGALVLNGLAPLVVVSRIRLPGTGALVLTGLAPTLGFACLAPAGALVLQGRVPTLGGGTLAEPGTGALVLQGQGVTLGFELHPGTGTLVLTGLTPSLAFVCPAPTGALVLQGLAPRALTSEFLEVPTGALVLTGQTPSLGFGCPAPAGALVLQGQAPGLVSGTLMQPPAGALVLTGQAPTGQVQAFRAPGAGALVLQGQAPTIPGGSIIDVPTGALVLAGQVPVLSFTIPIDPGGALVLNGLAPTLVHPIAVAVPTGVLVLNGLAPTRVTGAPALPPAGALVLTGLVPAIPTIPGVGSLVLAGLAPLVQFNTVPTGALVLQGLAPARQTTQTIAVPSTELRLDGYAPAIEGDIDLIITVQTQLRLDGHTPTLAIGGAGTTGALVLAGLAPSLSFLVGSGLFTPGAGALVFNGLAPSQGFTSPAICPAPAALVLAGTVNVEAALVIDVPTGALVLQGQLADVRQLIAGFDTPTVFNMRRLRQAPFLEQEDDRIYHERFQLNLQIGVGLETGAAEVLDPKISLDWSDDSAHTWSNTYAVSAGPIGTELRVRALWYRLGAPRKRIYRVTMDTPVKWALIDAYIQLKPGHN